MMNHGKKLLSLLLVVIMLLGMMQTVALAGVNVVASDAVITLVPSKTEALQPGDTFTVTARIENNPGYISAAFNIAFDKTALTATGVNVARADAFSIGKYAANLEKDYGAFVTFASAEPDTESSGTLFSMNFTVNEGAANGNYSICINAEHADHLFDYQDAEAKTTFHTWDASYVPATVTVGSNESESKIKLGDVNGDGEITARDASLAYMAYNETYEPSDAEFAAMDVYVDGEITARDASLIYMVYNEVYSFD